MFMGNEDAHFIGGRIRIKNYAINIIKGANSFNSFSGGVADNTTDNSHILTNIDTTGAKPESIAFYDDKSKLILDFGDRFEFGSRYALNKLVVHYDSRANSLPVDFYRLTLQNPDIYKLTQSGEYFIVNELSGGEIHTPITESSKK